MSISHVAFHGIVRCSSSTPSPQSVRSSIYFYQPGFALFLAQIFIVWRTRKLKGPPCPWWFSFLLLSNGKTLLMKPSTIEDRSVIIPSTLRECGDGDAWCNPDDSDSDSEPDLDDIHDLYFTNRIIDRAAMPAKYHYDCQTCNQPDQCL